MSDSPLRNFDVKFTAASSVNVSRMSLMDEK